MDNFDEVISDIRNNQFNSTQLDLMHQNLTDDDVILLVNLILEKKILITSLAFPDNLLTNNVISHILKVNSLEHLDLSNNIDIDDGGALQIATICKETPINIQCIELSGANVGNEGLLALVNIPSLINPTNPGYILLNGSIVTDEVKPEIIAKSSLPTISLTGHKLSEETLREIETHIDKIHNILPAEANQLDLVDPASVQTPKTSSPLMVNGTQQDKNLSVEKGEENITPPGSRNNRFD